MKRMVRMMATTALLVLVAVTLPGCHRVAESLSRNIALEGVEKIDYNAGSGVEVVLRVRNDSRNVLGISEAQLGLRIGGTLVGRVMLRDAVQVPRKTTASVATGWRLRMEDPVSLLSLTRAWKRKELNKIEVDVRVRGNSGPLPIIIRRDRIPLSEFLDNFDLSVDQLDKMLK